MNIIFFGTSNFALPILEALNKNYSVVGVVTTPDAPFGRKKVMTESPVSALATELKLPLFKPESLKDNNLFRLELGNLNANLFVVAAYGKIIPQEIIDIPQYKTLNAHPSLLPKYRGPSPIQYALLNGDETTGTSIMVIDSEVDHGPVLTMENLSIDTDDNFITLSDKLARASAKLITLAIPDYVSGILIPQPQDHEKATYSKIITKQDGKIDFQKSSFQIYNQFRAFYPWPGIWTTWQGKIVKIIDCIPADTSSVALPGTVADGGMVLCGNQTGLQIKILQQEGKSEMGISDFLNGNKEMIGSKLE